MIEMEIKGLDELNAKVLSLIGELNIPYQEVFPQEARLLALECMKRTPPFPNGNVAGSNSSDAKKAGEVTVEGDVERAQTPISTMFKEETKNKYLRKIIRKKDVGRLQAAFDNIPSMKSWKVDPFNKEYHKRARGPVGSRYKVTDQRRATLEDKSAKSYAREMKKKPGWLKSGWGIAVSLLQGRVPAWISRHFGTAPGGMDMDVSDNNPAPYVRIYNYAPTIGRYKSMYEFAIRERIDSITTKVNQALERRLNKTFTK